MNLARGWRLWRAARTAYSPHPVARLYRAWRRFAGENCAADILLLPLAGLTLTLFFLRTVPGAVDAVAAACSTVCMP